MRLHYDELLGWRAHSVAPRSSSSSTPPPSPPLCKHVIVFILKKIVSLTHKLSLFHFRSPNFPSYKNVLALSNSIYFFTKIKCAPIDECSDPSKCNQNACPLYFYFLKKITRNKNCVLHTLI